MDEVHDKLEAAFADGQRKSFDKDNLILMAGERPSGIYYIIEGYVAVYTVSSREETYTHIVYGRGEIFPLSWVFSDIKRDIYYKAVSDTSCYLLTQEAFQAKLKSDAALANVFCAQVIDQFKAYSDRVSILTYKYARERLAFQLLFTCSRFATKEGHTYVLPKYVTQQLLANQTNSSRESVSREIERFESRGFVAMRGRQITITNAPALATEVRDVSSDEWWEPGS